jgi:hypothetical protein
MNVGKQLGPWFYAPALTSFVTPFFMNFLLGPARVNYRKDGQLGGMVVEKCKFLQVISFSLDTYGMFFDECLCYRNRIARACVSINANSQHSSSSLIILVCH